ASARFRYRDRIVFALPTIFLRPIKREHDLASRGQRSRRQVEQVEAQAGVAGVRVLRTLPADKATVHPRGIEQLDAQLLVLWDRPGLVVDPPSRELSRRLFNLVALHR